MEIHQPPEKFHLRLLSPRVLVVATFNDFGNEWAAYIDAMPSKNYQEDFMQVAKTGSKLNHAIAKILFPTLDKKYRWRT